MAGSRFSSRLFWLPKRDAQYTTDDGGVFDTTKNYENAQALASQRYVEWQVRRWAFSSCCLFFVP